MRSLLAGCLCLVFLGCCATDTLEDRKMAEFRWDEIHARSPMFEIPCTFPSWLEEEDKEKVLDALDGYWMLMLELIPESSMVDVTTYVIHIHDNLGCFWVDDPGTWCHGWQIGHHIQISWSWDMLNRFPNGIASKNPFAALAHEWLHIIVDMYYGWEDVSHMYFPFYASQLAMIAEEAPTILLSDLSKIKCHLYRYVPAEYGYIK